MKRPLTDDLFRELIEHISKSSKWEINLPKVELGTDAHNASIIDDILYSYDEDNIVVIFKIEVKKKEHLCGFYFESNGGYGYINQNIIEEEYKKMLEKKNLQ